MTHGGDRGAYLMDWFVTRNGKVVGPLTVEGVVEAVRRGDLARNDCVWDPSADKWQLAAHVPEFWAEDLETSSLDHGGTSWSKRATWLRAVAAALIVGGSALLLSVTIRGSSEDQRPPSAKLNCSLEAYLQGKCR